MNNIEKETIRFFSTYNLDSLNLDELVDIIQMQGYDLIEFSKDNLTQELSELAEKLSILPNIMSEKAFTYCNDEIKLVFIDEELNSNEKLLALAHEEGHIWLKHFGKQSTSKSDVECEHEANEFAHYVIKPNKTIKSKLWIITNKDTVVVLSIILFVLLMILYGLCYLSNHKLYKNSVLMLTLPKGYYVEKEEYDGKILSVDCKNKNIPYDVITVNISSLNQNEDLFYDEHEFANLRQIISNMNNPKELYDNTYGEGQWGYYEVDNIFYVIHMVDFDNDGFNDSVHAETVENGIYYYYYNIDPSKAGDINNFYYLIDKAKYPFN